MRYSIERYLIKPKTDYLILLGQAQNRHTISLEQGAINLINTPTRDNDGKFYLNRIIKEMAMMAILILSMQAGLLKNCSTYPISLSYSAGVYVCNYAFYLALYYVSKLNLSTKIGFIHFPLYQHQTEDSLPTLELDTMVKATNHILQLLLKK